MIVLKLAILNGLHPGIGFLSAKFRSVSVLYPDFVLALLKWEMKFSFGTLDLAFPSPGWEISSGNVIFYRTGVKTLE